MDRRVNFSMKGASKIVRETRASERRVQNSVPRHRTRPRGSGGGIKSKVMRVTEVANDWLVCTAVGSETPIKVAKPYRFRKTGWHTKTVNGITYTYSDSQHRTASQGPDSESQVILPLYAVGSEIIGIQVVGSDLKGDGTFEDGENEDMDVCSYIDINADGRVWAQAV